MQARRPGSKPLTVLAGRSCPFPLRLILRDRVGRGLAPLALRAASIWSEPGGRQRCESGENWRHDPM